MHQFRRKTSGIDVYSYIFPIIQAGSRRIAEQTGLIAIGQAARLLMISEERIRQPVKQGFIPKQEKRGFVQFVGAMECYLRYLKDDERRSARSAVDSRVRDGRAPEIELRMDVRPGLPVIDGYDTCLE